jgi:hypothetical protein
MNGWASPRRNDLLLLCANGRMSLVPRLSYHLRGDLVSRGGRSISILAPVLVSLLHTATRCLGLLGQVINARVVCGVAWAAGIPVGPRR